MARVFFAILICTSLAMAIPMPKADEPAPAGGDAATTPAPSGANSNNQNMQGVFVNGYNCTTYIEQCKSNSQNFNTSGIPVTPAPGQGDQLTNSSNNACSAEAQSFCGNIYNNPISNNINNANFVNQNQNITQIQNSFPITQPPNMQMPTAIPMTIPGMNPSGGR